jgi:hypothetical protein
MYPRDRWVAEAQDKASTNRVELVSLVRRPLRVEIVTRIVRFAVLAFAIASLAAPADAAPRTFVSAAGSGTLCTRALPCDSFQTAYTATDSRGEINCLDAGEYGGLSIAKSITIDCTDVIGASAGQIAIVDDALTVRLRGLTLRGGVASFRSVTAFIENCVITGSAGPGISGTAPSFGSPVRLFVSDTLVSGNFIGISLSRDGPGPALRATLARVRVEKNRDFGILVGASNSNAVVLAHIRNSVVSGNGLDGVRVVASNDALASVTLDRVSSTLNGGAGVSSTRGSGIAAPSVVVIGRSAVLSNQTGLATSGGGTIFSYQNNHLTGNVTEGAPNALLSLK